jgi:hypothetical protein
LKYYYLTTCYIAGTDHFQEDYEAARIKVVAYDRLNEQPIYMHAELLLKIFYQLLEVLPISFKVCMSDDCWLLYGVYCGYVSMVMGSNLV